MMSSNAPDSLSLLSNDELIQNTDNASEARVYPIVEIIAPESLPQGYTFDVDVNHEILTVTVPWGGISKGQKVRMQTEARIEDNRQRLRIPVGGWKDGIMDFCTFGPFHSSLCLSLCCPLISLGQIFTRLGLNWHVEPSDNPSSHLAFKVMVSISVFYFTVLNLLGDPSSGSQIASHNIYLLHLFLVTILAGKTRAYIRNAYDIPATVSKSAADICSIDESTIPPVVDCMEDYVCSCVCAPCVISQMNRHTAMYDTYDSSYCSSNGMPKYAPMMV